MKIKNRPVRLNEDFLFDLKDINLKRIKLDIDDEPLSMNRITRGIIREPEWKIIKEKLIKKPRDRNLG